MRWLNESRPKQFCCFSSDQMMIETAWQRGLLMAPTERQFTVITQGQEQYLENRHLVGSLLVQPHARGTAVGVALLISKMLQQDAEATAILMPADHFVYPLAPFNRRLHEAARYVQAQPTRIVTMAAVPQSPEKEYGWIAKDMEGRVEKFHEKPSAETAQRYYEQGYLWNTMITVGRAQTLWDLIESSLPAVTHALAPLIQVGHLDLNAAMKDLKPADFSSRVVEPNSDRFQAMELTDVFWSDWGRPERLVESMVSLNLNHKIPADLTRQYANTVGAS